MKLRTLINTLKRSGQLPEPNPPECSHCETITKLVAVVTGMTGRRRPKVEWLCHHCHYWLIVKEQDDVPERKRPAPPPGTRARFVSRAAQGLPRRRRKNPKPARVRKRNPALKRCQGRSWSNGGAQCGRLCEGEFCWQHGG